MNTPDTLATELLPAVRKAAWRLVNRYDARHEIDDLLGVGALALVQALPRILAGDIEDPAAHVYTVARNAGVDYLRRCKPTPVPDIEKLVTSHRLPELELISRHDDCWASILSACHDDLDRQIVTLRNEGHRRNAIARRLGVDKATVSRRLKAIHKRLINS